jgi:hypothetical protein
LPFAVVELGLAVHAAMSEAALAMTASIPSRLPRLYLRDTNNPLFCQDSGIGPAALLGDP